MIILLTLISILIISIIVYFQNAFSYWKRKNVPYIKPSFPLGSIKMSFPKHAMDDLQEIYKKFKDTGTKYGGIYIFHIPILIPIDADAVKSILSTNFESFHDRGIYCDEKIDPLSAILPALSGNKWKNMRGKLSSTFSSAKIKMMFSTLIACSTDIDKLLDKTALKNEALNIKELAAAFATDVISSCAFGLENNCIVNSDADFRKYGKLFFKTNIFEKLKLILAFFKPSLLQILKIPMYKRKVTKYFISLVKETINYRETNKVHRNDFMDLLIRIKNNENIDDSVFFTGKTAPKIEGNGDSITAAQIAAQAFVFFLAGFETSATSMTYTMMELAQNLVIQDKLREEILNIIEKNNGELTYDGINEMEYLDNVIQESLRKNSPVLMLNRMCTKETKLENTDITIEKGTRVLIPLRAIHSDPEYYPNPEVFDPNRFTNEEIVKRPPCTYLPFGEGSRYCIGMRFGIIQTKIGIIQLLRKYKYTIHEKTKMPIKFISNIVLVELENMIYLKVEKI